MSDLKNIPPYREMSPEGNTPMGHVQIHVDPKSAWNHFHELPSAGNKMPPNSFRRGWHIRCVLHAHCTSTRRQAPQRPRTIIFIDLEKSFPCADKNLVFCKASRLIFACSRDKAIISNGSVVCISNNWWFPIPTSTAGSCRVACQYFLEQLTRAERSALGSRVIGDRPKLRSPEQWGKWRFEWLSPIQWFEMERSTNEYWGKLSLLIETWVRIVYYIPDLNFGFLCLSIEISLSLHQKLVEEVILIWWLKGWQLAKHKFFAFHRTPWFEIVWTQQVPLNPIEPKTFCFGSPDV